MVGVRYDAAILGAGPDGLAAAARLARAGLKTVVIERATEPGGRCTTREFHPGFRASPFADELPPIPAGIFWSLDLARRGVVFAPPAPDAFVRDGRVTIADGAAMAPLLERVEARVGRELSRSDGEAERAPPRRNWFPWLKPLRLPSPDEWSRRSLLDAVKELPPPEAAALMARALAGRAVDPSLRGTALHLLAPVYGQSGMVAGGLASLGEALAAAAREAGAEIRCGLEATGVRRVKDRVKAVLLADGSEIETAAILSTLDLKRTVLSLFAWSELPKPVVKRAANYRMSGSTARLLVALDTIPDGAPRAVLHTAETADAYAAACASWRTRALPQHPPASVRVVSATDPRLAPHGKATVTITLGCIPHRLFDGTWTGEKRDTLRQRALALMESVLPGTAERVLASALLLPADIEEALGVTDGDLAGGEIAADQMFANRAWPEWPRTPIHGLYLGGPSSAVGPVATAAAGWLAAKALVVDHHAGRFK